MVITCDKCQAKYNIDEKKIPDTGIKAKCAKCGNILIIEKPAPEKPEKIIEPKPQPKPEPKPEPIVTKPTPKPGIEEPISTEGMSEEEKRWHERARRLAKALASDLTLYHKEKVEEGLREGTLAKLLGAEIRRSWEYYCQQIPKHIIESTNYFKDALNRIVGKGRELFR